MAVNERQCEKVLVLYAGGTIGMKINCNNVYIPACNEFLEKIRGNPQMHDPHLAIHYCSSESQLVLPKVNSKVILYEFKEYYPLLDSSDMTTNDWIRIATDIERYYEHFCGFVILHGTDTMVYTASALSFMLENLSKPIIITGAQIPIFETRSDALDNMLPSIILAGCYKIPEVCIFFANKLMRGNRSTKVSTDLLNAFDSPNYHLLANIGISINVYSNYIAQFPTQPFKVTKNLDSNVALLMIFPTMTAPMIEKFTSLPIRGLVIQSFGCGNIPSKNAEILDALHKAVENKIIVVNITQCAQGAVNVSYNGGRKLKQSGIVVGYDMTAEAAFTKLCFVLALPDLDYKQRVKLMETNLRGEVTTSKEHSLGQLKELY